jgi:DNA-binding LacI/PurR family transcriptional regulator
VSRATVSNAYNRPDQLSVELRAHVLETARRLGYTGPDPAARALVRGRTGVVGALFSEPLDYAFEDPAAVLVLRGLAQECRETHTGLLLLPIELDDAVAEDAVHGAAVDGLVAYSLPDDAPVLRAARDRGLPPVVIDQPQVEGIAIVSQDDRESARWRSTTCSRSATAASPPWATGCTPNAPTGPSTRPGCTPPATGSAASGPAATSRR